jgi:ascorbate PTS system EIIB component
MLKILMVCGAGLGSSFAIQMTVESVLKDLGVEASLDHSDISSASGLKADIIISATTFESQFQRYDMQSDLIFLKNLVDKNEIKEKLVPVLEEKGIL